MLSGCASSEPGQEPDALEENSKSLEENSVNTPPEDNNEVKEQSSESDSNSNDLASYVEYNTITDVAEVAGLKSIVETDNPGTRVILFEDENGRKMLKSIYVKKEKRLKVISLDDDGLLYNGILK